MRYATARYMQHQRDVAYRFYITDCLRNISENAAKSVYALSHGTIDASYIDKRYAAIVGVSTTEENVEEKSGDDVLKDFLRHFGLEVDDD